MSEEGGGGAAAAPAAADSEPAAPTAGADERVGKLSCASCTLLAPTQPTTNDGMKF
jgi:hypothetical protein